MCRDLSCAWSRKRASARWHTLPAAGRLTVVPGPKLCLESEAVEGERQQRPLLGRMGAILRFGQNAVKTPGRTHDNHCVTKGLKVSLKPFQRLGVAHVPEGAKPRQGCRSRAAPWSPSAEGETLLYGVSIFLCYFLFAIEKESRRLPTCNRVPRKYTPVGCFARTKAVTGPRGQRPQGP